LGVDLFNTSMGWVVHVWAWSAGVAPGSWERGDPKSEAVCPNHATQEAVLSHRRQNCPNHPQYCTKKASRPTWGTTSVWNCASLPHP
jgi:hypothetical protein